MRGQWSQREKDEGIVSSAEGAGSLQCFHVVAREWTDHSVKLTSPPPRRLIDIRHSDCISRAELQLVIVCALVIVERTRIKRSRCFLIVFFVALPSVVSFTASLLHTPQTNRVATPWIAAV